MTAPDCVSPGRVPSPPQGRASRKGVALVVVLAFVVLLTGIVVAFLTRALSQKQIATSSANQTTAELFAQGALDTVVGDLKTEITTLSTATTVTTGSSTLSLYSPSTAAAATPALVPSTIAAAAPAPGTSTAPTGLENLLKISKSTAAFFPPSGPARAASLPTGAASLNGRFISPERWNAPLLVAKQDPDATATTPVAAFPIPDWVLVARDGSNPTGTLPGSAKWSLSDPKTVIGRYAYAIYNEGGLLDINSAGYPSGLTAPQTGSKMALAFADLTQINPNPATQTYLNQKEIDAIVGWRNYASAQPLGAFPNPGFLTDSRIPNASANFYNFIRLTPNGIIPPANTTLFNGQSDRTFSSRQQLLTFLSALGETSTPSRRANLQNAAQYLGTFSRVLNQPSFRPNPTRPKVVGGAYLAPSSSYSGGNDAFGADDRVNPWFRTIRATGTFVRTDGTPATGGEPLVKRRFALNRLAWLTCKGPSANLPASDILYQQYVSLGIPPRLLSEGTPQNIRNYFGLVWTPGPGSGGIGGYWTYGHDFPTKIATLENVRDAATKREPDFFELLKAGAGAGSLAKGAASWGSDSSTPLFRFYGTQDTLIDNQIIQLGANIIDQASPDSFPTRIVFDNGTYPLSFYGVDDLPYLYNEFNLNILVRKSTPEITTDLACYPVTTPGTFTAFVPPEDPGLVAAVLVPTIWNPHSQGTPVAAGLAPTNLRICTSMRSFSSPTAAASSPGSLTASSTPYSMAFSTPPYPGNEAQKLNTAAVIVAPWSQGNYEAATGSITMPASGTAGNTAMTFKNEPALYREPTPLVRPGVPVNSDLALENNNAMATAGSASWNTGIPEVNTGVNYIGFYIGQFPLRFKVADVDRTTTPPTPITKTYTTTNAAFGEASHFGTTVSLEYQAGGRWIPYIQTLVPHRSRTAQPVPYNYAASQYNGSRRRAGVEMFGGTTNDWNANTQAVALWDPRSRRWTPWCNTYAGSVIDRPPSAATPLAAPNYRSMIATYRSDNNLGQGPGTVVRAGGASQDMNINYPLGTGWNFIDVNRYITDPDRVIRRAMGGLAPSTSAGTATTTVGLPLATVRGNAANASNRPILLHRPFRSVAELGYVFSDTPWRNIDFSKPESGTAALLDVFCVSDPGSELVSGRVDLNTRQAPVLKALLGGAGRDELTAGSVLSTTEADAIARALVSRTTDTATVGKGPLSNIADLVGRFGSGFKNGAATDASQPYDGFSKDLGGLFTGGASSPNNIVSRHRESVIRALSDTGQAGTWNLLIDLVAQVGKYPASAVNPQDFVVEGEKRYWLHVAIDRQTAQVIDQQLEPVTE